MTTNAWPRQSSGLTEERVFNGATIASLSFDQIDNLLALDEHSSAGAGQKQVVNKMKPQATGPKLYQDDNGNDGRPVHYAPQPTNNNNTNNSRKVMLLFSRDRSFTKTWFQFPFVYGALSSLSQQKSKLDIVSPK